jgi:hypothetical protein
VHGEQPLDLDRWRLAALEAEPVAPLKLGLDRADAVGSLGMAVAGVVLERRRVAEEDGHGRRYGTGA